MSQRISEIQFPHIVHTPKAPTAGPHPWHCATVNTFIAAYPAIGLLPKPFGKWKGLAEARRFSMAVWKNHSLRRFAHTVCHDILTARFRAQRPLAANNYFTFNWIRRDCFHGRQNRAPMGWDFCFVLGRGHSFFGVVSFFGGVIIRHPRIEYPVGFFDRD